jgi:phosphoglucosamine mutase
LTRSGGRPQQALLREDLMARLFGTDGIRGLANADLSPELALGVAIAAARVLVEVDSGRTGKRVAVVGRDSRASGEMLSSAVSAGLTSAGMDVWNVGVLPTPAIAFLTKELEADLGVMISASHNPMPDNGIKLFSQGGHKLDDEIEDAIQLTMDQQWQRPTGGDIGRLRRRFEARERYSAHLLSTVTYPLSGLRVVVDCAHGAASAVAPSVYSAAGADVISIGANPNGWNINDGVGSTYISGLREAVLYHRAHIGLAHDGDADRCLAVDERGRVVDGDQILAVCALAMKERGQLRKDTLVATVMSNLGLDIAMRERDIRLEKTDVGDRYVLERMRAMDLSLGGEQSGHVVFLDYATTGDGILTGLQLMGRLAQTGLTLSELASVVHRLPQVLLNVPVQDKGTAVSSQAAVDAVAEAEAELGDQGRVLLRPSGTENLVRVMVEAASEFHAKEIAERIAAAVAAPS